MGTRGPVPKRSDQRVRRNKDGVDIDTVAMIGNVAVPPLGLEDPHPVVAEMYSSLVTSGQAKFYEPSDWAFAKYTMHFADRLIKANRPSSQMLVAVNSMMTDLLVSEGSRRRVRMEVERQQESQGGAVIDAAHYWKTQLGVAE